MLIISLLGIVVFLILNVRKLKLRGHLLSNVVKIMLFISDAQYYVPVKLPRTAGSTHLFKITGHLLPDHVKLNKHILQNIIEICSNTILWFCMIFPCEHVYSCIYDYIILISFKLVLVFKCILPDLTKIFYVIILT